VEVGIRGARSVEIVSGLTDGERIIAQPPDTLRDGQRVRAVERWRDNS
jgi:multidrug efflux pump subunit AcrA (membrane-fusion protein)